jgi:competence protein ComGC
MEPSGKNLTGWHAAFTRVDLAVVLAMVGVLLIIVFSAYAKPHNRVYQITDVSNHRRLMQAMTAFAGDNSDTLPNCGWGRSSGNIRNDFANSDGISHLQMLAGIVHHIPIILQRLVVGTVQCASTATT